MPRLVILTDRRALCRAGNDVALLGRFSGAEAAFHVGKLAHAQCDVSTTFCHRLAEPQWKSSGSISATAQHARAFYSEEWEQAV